MSDSFMIQENFWRNGPSPGNSYCFPYQSPKSDKVSTKTRTLVPIVTGTSVIGLKFRDGVIVAADKLGSYGSLARYRNISRVVKVNDCTVIGGGGDIADFQYIQRVVNQQVIEDESLDDGFGYTPRSLFSWLTRIVYIRRTRMDPLWNNIIVGGIEGGEPFLGCVDKLAVAYEGNSLATGFGSHLAVPILREVESSSPSLSREQAIQAITRCMTVLYYRDAHSLNKYDIAVVTKEGVEIMENIKSNTNWDIGLTITENT